MRFSHSLLTLFLLTLMSSLKGIDGNQNSSSRTTLQANGLNGLSSTMKRNEPLVIRTHSSYQVKSEQKATHVLGLVFFAFVVCWTPFFTLSILTGFMQDLEVSGTLWITFTWLGYLSSTFNPIIYTIFNRNFRTAFRRIIFLQFTKFNSRSHATPMRASTSSHRVSTQNNSKVNNTSSNSSKEHRKSFSRKSRSAIHSLFGRKIETVLETVPQQNSSIRG